MSLLRNCLLSGLLAATPALAADPPKVQVQIAPGSTAPAIQVQVQASNAGSSKVTKREDADEKGEKEKKDKDKKEKKQVQAAAGAVAYRYGNGRVDRDSVDPKDNTERVLILASGTPVIAQFEINMDGKPFRVQREKLIDEMLAEADKDEDGKATWTEALENPRFAAGRFRYSLRNDQQKAAILKSLDRNSDGLVDRGELRNMMAQQFGGPTFNLTSNYRGRVAPDIKQLLDANKDGTVDKEEIAAAESRLKSRDANANDLVESSELGGTPNNRFGNGQIVLVNGRRQFVQPDTTAVLLGPAANMDQVYQSLVQAYGGKEKELIKENFNDSLGLFSALDVNKDGKVERTEVDQLNDIDPHVVMSVNLGKEDSGITLKTIDTRLKQSAAESKDPVIDLGGTRLQLKVGASIANRYVQNYERYAQQTIQRLDTDKNGYIEKKELDGNNRGFAQQFDVWDRDQDGKVYAKEITETYVRQQAPAMSMVSMVAYKAGNPFFAALDVSGDSRLSLREMKYAAERLVKFDTNGDGQIGQDEVPTTIHIGLGQGYQVNYGQSVAYRVQGGQANNRPANAKGPDWFIRMDRNGDGDVTLKEFLGDEEQFRRLDLDKDGFITPEEAEKSTETQAQK